jgi:hypothetical protein
MQDWLAPEATVPGDAEDKMMNALIFALLWSIGG